MKILYYNHTGQVSGAERVLLLILAQVSRDRFEPVLMCPADGTLQDDAKTLGVCCENVNQLQARFTARPDHLFRYLLSFISLIREVRERVTEIKPELIHANSIRSGLVMSAATIGLRVPVIWHVHDLLPMHPLSTLIRFFLVLFPPVRVVTVARASGNRLRGRLPRLLANRINITVIHNAIDVQKIHRSEAERSALGKQLRVKSGDVLIGIVGNLSSGKCQLELITAFAGVLKSIPEAVLIIVGSAIFNRDDGYEQRLLIEAKALGIANRVRFLGQRTDVPVIMGSLDLLVLNSRSEAFPLVALEGLACGIPVLSTAVGGVPELITHDENGWLVTPGDQRELKEAIVSLVSQPQLRARLATNGRKHVETNFTVARFISLFETVYDETTAPRAANSKNSQSQQANKRHGSTPLMKAGVSGAECLSATKIAVFHDNFAQMGGAERVAEEIYNLLPGATLHTTAAVPEILSERLQQTEIKTSWMQRLPGLKRHFRHYFLLYPFAVESTDLSKYDLIVSSCFGYAKGVHKRRGAVHVCYCHTPMRWVWRYEDYSARAGFNGVTRRLLPVLLSVLKRWDLRASKQPDYFIANSQVVAARLKQFYGRDSVVIPPPIDVNRFKPQSDEPSTPDDYYLVLSRLVPYKRIDLAIEACTRLNRPLVIVGDGPDRKRLEKLAGPTVRFVGRQSDESVARYAASCRALLFPGEEDFGMTPLEVNAAGRPVIAFRAGGALETVIEGKTGSFFDEPTAASLGSAIEDFEPRSWDSSELRAHACGFDRTVFANRLLEFLRGVAPGVQVELDPIWKVRTAVDHTSPVMPDLQSAI